MPRRLNGRLWAHTVKCRMCHSSTISLALDVYDACCMQIETIVGLSVVLSFGAAAYLDHKEESARKAGAELPQLWQWTSIVIFSIIAVILAGMSAYLFSQVPVLLCEITAGIILGSLALRLFFRIA